MTASAQGSKRLHNRNVASLFGGLATAVAVFVGVVLLARNFEWPTIAAALALAIGVGGYIRLADL